jgi:hypothetical protein
MHRIGSLAVNRVEVESGSLPCGLPFGASTTRGALRGPAPTMPEAGRVAMWSGSLRNATRHPLVSDLVVGSGRFREPLPLDVVSPISSPLGSSLVSAMRPLRQVLPPYSTLVDAIG